MHSVEIYESQVSLDPDFDAIGRYLTSTRFSNEFIQECHRFVHGNVIFELNRYLQLPENDTSSGFRTELPPYESLVPFDGDNKWILTASVVVLDGNNPDQMQKGTEELAAVASDFEGCFNLKRRDRHTFDTRIKF